MSTDDKTPALKSATDALKPHEPKLLDAFAKVFRRKRPPQSMRALAPLAMVFLLEAFGLSFLLDRETVRAAIRAARGPGKDEDDLLVDSDEMIAIRWAAARQDALDRAYMTFAREQHKNDSTSHSFAEWIKRGYGPDRVAFERRWGERNPIDPATAPKCFDPSAQLSILDAVGQGDGYLGAFVSDVSLRSEAPPVVECMGQTLDLGACESLDAAVWRAVSKGWIAYLDHRGAVVGLRLIPRTDGVQTRLRAPLANIVAMYAQDKRDEQIAQLEADKMNLADSNRSMAENIVRLTNELEVIEYQWRYATGAPSPEMAHELMARRIEQIANLLVERDAPRSSMSEMHAEIEDERSADTSKLESVEVPQSVGRMIWPDPDNAPDVIKCSNAIVAHRRGEFAELVFPSTQKIFEQVRAWLMFYQMNICARTPDETGYSTNAIGTNGEIPPKWSTMKQAQRNSYPGFVLFAPDDSAKVVFCAREPSIGKVGKRKAKESKS
jgi:hypothetical protein